MSTRKMDDLNLKDAFAPMPDTCHAALMNAARSVKEEENMKRASYRVVLISAAIILATMVAAFAAEQLGLVDFFQNDYGVALPDSAKTVLSATEQKTYTVGPLDITLRETLADGRTVYVTTQAKPSGGVKALVTGEDPLRISDVEAARLNLPKGTSFVEAAKQANIPLYIVSSYLTIDWSYINGEEMQANMAAEDGSALLVDMLQTNPAVVPETLTGMLTVRVRELDPTTGDYAEGKDWQLEEEISIPVHGVTEEKTYAPVGEALVKGYTVQSVKAEKTCAGVYLTATLTAGADAVQEDAWRLMFKDAQGQNFPCGINLSGVVDIEGWPHVIMGSMISLNTLPRELQLVFEKDSSGVILK